MKITVLSENTSLSEKLRAEYGLSVYVECGSTRLLFDTGCGSAFMENAGTLGVDLSACTAVAFSHNHRDHCGGFLSLKGILRPDCPVYAHEGFFTDKWWDHHFDGPLTDTQAPTVEHVGPVMVASDLFRDGLTGFRILVDDVFEIGDGIFLVGNFPQPKGMERVFRSQLKTGMNGRLVRDDFRDEQICVIRTPEGLVLLTGCAHHGILNIIDTVNNRFPGERIRAVIGGTHLVPFDEKRALETAKRLENLGMECAALCHCTGPALPVMADMIGAYSCTGAGFVWESNPGSGL